MERREIILTRGIQASGKSTYAEHWAKEKPTERIRINWDSLRNMFGQYWVEEREKLNIIKEMTDAFFKSSMENGLNIIMDNMNLNPKGWKEMQDRIDNYNNTHTKYQYELVFKDFFDVSVEECIKRDSMRTNPIGESVIKRTYRQYRNFIATELNKKQYNSFVPYDKDKKDCILVDMDATLCFNLQGRPFYGNGASDTMTNDVPCEQICKLVNKYIKDDNVKVIILTGREDTPDIRKATETWLKNNLDGDVDMVIMRPYKNFTKGSDCKYNLYKTFIEPYYNVLFVLEDSSKVVKMWREHGIMCLQPNDGTM